MNETSKGGTDVIQTLVGGNWEFAVAFVLLTIIVAFCIAIGAHLWSHIRSSDGPILRALTDCFFAWVIQTVVLWIGALEAVADFVPGTELFLVFLRYEWVPLILLVTAHARLYFTLAFAHRKKE